MIYSITEEAFVHKKGMYAIMGYFLILVKSAVNISESVLIRKYNEKHKYGSMFFTGIISLAAMIFFLLSDTDGFHASTEILPYSLVFGAIYCISYLFTYVALACGPFTLSMLIISYSLIFSIVYGIVWLHDPITPFTYIGFALLAVSLFLVRGAKKDENHKISLKWLIAISVTSAGNGILAIVQKMQQLRFDNAYNHEFMVISLALSALVLLCLGGAVRDRAHIRKSIRYGTPYAATAGFANGLNNYLAMIINNYIPISISVPLISGVKIVMSYLISRALFKERYLKRQIVGVVIGAAALVFLNL